MTTKEKIKKFAIAPPVNPHRKIDEDAMLRFIGKHIPIEPNQLLNMFFVSIIPLTDEEKREHYSKLTKEELLKSL